MVRSCATVQSLYSLLITVDDLMLTTMYLGRYEIESTASVEVHDGPRIYWTESMSIFYLSILPTPWPWEIIHKNEVLL